MSMVLVFHLWMLVVVELFIFLLRSLAGVAEAAL